jgi:hypothetical protein
MNQLQAVRIGLVGCGNHGGNVPQAIDARNR